jgi:hypothetical protein
MSADDDNRLPGDKSGIIICQEQKCTCDILTSPSPVTSSSDASRLIACYSDLGRCCFSALGTVGQYILEARQRRGRGNALNIAGWQA